MISTVLVDSMIRNRCEEQRLVTPYDPNLVNPASIDLQLGDHLLLESCEKGFVEYRLNSHNKQNPFLFRPGEFVLAPSLETINMPDDLVGEVMLKSSMARQGVDHLKAGYLDPGWHGSSLTMELKNVSQLRVIPLWPGMRIVQIKLTLLSIPPDVSYSQCGRYNNDQKAQPAKP
jgi:dCTP deaminase